MGRTDEFFKDNKTDSDRLTDSLLSDSEAVSLTEFGLDSPVLTENGYTVLEVVEKLQNLQPEYRFSTEKQLQQAIITDETLSADEKEKLIKVSKRPRKAASRMIIGASIGMGLFLAGPLIPILAVGITVNLVGMITAFTVPFVFGRMVEDGYNARAHKRLEDLKSTKKQMTKLLLANPDLQNMGYKEFVEKLHKGEFDHMKLDEQTIGEIATKMSKSKNRETNDLGENQKSGRSDRIAAVRNEEAAIKLEQIFASGGNIAGISENMPADTHENNSNDSAEAVVISAQPHSKQDSRQA